MVINGLEYNVNFVEPDNGTLQNNGSDRYIGITYHGRGEIYVNGSLKAGLLRTTVMHEITHAYIYAYGFDARNKYGKEDLCEFLTAYAEKIIADTNTVMASKEDNN